MRIHTKAPWYEMYPRDYIYNTRSMDATELGIHISLSNYYWINKCEPINSEEVDRIIKSIKVRKQKFSDFKNKYPFYFVNDNFTSPELDSALEKVVQQFVKSGKGNDAKALKKKEKELSRDSHTDTDTNTESHIYKQSESKKESKTDSNIDSNTNKNTNSKYSVSKLLNDYPYMKNTNN